MFSRTVKERRDKLRCHFDFAKEFSTLEESCLPSYAHANKLAAWVAWNRLEVAARLYRRLGQKGAVLDFGSSTGELFHFLNIGGESYHYIEGHPYLAGFLKKEIPESVSASLDNLPENYFETVFALDSLEHNENVDVIVERLSASLNNGGVLIVSGPTENFLYRCGRWIAGFDGHYHKTNIYRIESIIEKYCRKIIRQNAPLGVPLFSISAWRKS